MADLWVRKVGTELVLQIKAQHSSEKAQIELYGRVDDKFTGKLVNNPESRTPILELRRKIL